MDSMVYKAFSAESIRFDEGERSAVSYITTNAPDRDNEVMLPSGMEKDGYNGVVLWMHDHYMGPIGRCAWLKRDGTKGWVAKTIFAATQAASDVWELVKGGFLTACSVGFDGSRAEHRLPTAKEKMQDGWANVGRVYTKWPLLEYSWVSVGANPDALVVAVNEKRLKVSERGLYHLQLAVGERRAAEAAAKDIAPARNMVYDPSSRRTLVTAPRRLVSMSA